MTRYSAVLLVLCATSGCASLPEQVLREPSFAFGAPATTALGRRFSGDIAAHPGESGFVPVVAGANALLLRLAFAGLAEKTLDLQYYIWNDDLTGRLLLREVMRAAERGVRVRLLLDDNHTGGETRLFGIVDAHPMIEVRLFNPFANRDIRIAGWVLEGARLNHRMHNKVMISDNALAISGGRNIGDHYFAVDELSNFRDLDLLAAGPITQDLSEMFDAYWNSDASYPIAAVTRKSRPASDAQALLEFLDGWFGAQAALPFALDADAGEMRGRIESFREDFHWGQAYTVFDSPARVSGDAGSRVAEFLFSTTDGVARELLIETAYFIPGESGVTILGELVARGVEVSVLTNSLATNDVAAAHAGYMGYRDDLVAAGVALYELRPDAVAEQQRMTLLASGSDAALHTKALVYDRRAVVVGSFNLDPRSLAINTEMGILVKSTALAEQVAGMILQGMQPQNSYRIVVRDGGLRWRTVTADGVEYLDSEPETSWWERFVAMLISLLPLQGQL
ncbi:MAG TPA: phospholipase D family protein [Gammaproteobacteria bacterium]